MPPLSIMVKPVSGRCNLHCRYCFYRDEMAHREQPLRPPMTAETLETLIRKACAFAEGTLMLAFQGGEPTLAGAAFFEEVVRLERRYGRPGLTIQNAVQTNGFDLPEELVALFAREDFLLGVSVDGTAALHDAMRTDAAGCGSFARVTENLRRLEAAGVRVNVLCVVNALVASAPKAVFEALAPHGYLQFIPCMDGLDGPASEFALTEEAYLRFLRETFELYYRRAMAGRPVSVRTFDNWVGLLLGRMPEECALTGRCQVQYVVESDGEIYPCDFYAVDAWALGNVRETNFRRLDKAERASAFRAVSEPVPPECAACRYYPLCRNGCRRERVAGRYRFCGAMRAFLAENVPRLEALARKACIR